MALGLLAAGLAHAVTFTVNSTGDANFACASTPSLMPGQRVAVTATNTATGGTSEFSRNFAGVGPRATKWLERMRWSER